MASNDETLYSTHPAWSFAKPRGETPESLSNTFTLLKEKRSWFTKQRPRLIAPFFMGTIRDVEGKHGTSVSCLFYYSRWLFLIYIVLGTVWLFAIVLPMIIVFDYSIAFDSFSFMHLINGQGPLSQLWLFFGSYTPTAYWYPLGFLYIVCMFFTVYFSSCLIILSISLAFQDEGVNILIQTTHGNLLFMSWDFSVYSHWQSVSQAARITTSIRDMRADIEMEKRLNTQGNQERIRSFRLRAAAWAIAIILVVSGCFTVYWIGSTDLVEAFRHYITNGFILAYTPSIAFVLVDVFVSTALYALPQMEMYVSSKDEFYATVTRIFLFKTSLVVLHFVGLRARIKSASFEGCGGTYIGQEMYRLIITKFAALVSSPTSYGLYWLILKKKREFYMPPFVQELIQCQAVGWVGTMVFPLMPWLMSAYVIASMYVTYFLLNNLSIPMRNRWHQPSRSIFFQTMTLAFQFIIVISVLFICLADTQFLFNVIGKANDTASAQKIHLRSVNRDPKGVHYCGPFSETEFIAPNDMLISYLRGFSAKAAWFTSAISSQGFLTSLLFIFAIVIHVLVVRVRWERTQREALLAELNMPEQHSKSIDELPSEHEEEVLVFGRLMSRERYFWFMSSFVCEIFFVLDIIFEFRTGYVDSETDEVVLDNKSIAFEYISTWFFIDFISVIPIDEIYEIYGPEDQKDYLKFRMMRLLKVLCLLRMFRFVRYLNHLEMYFLVDPIYTRLGNLLIIMGLFIHWSGCLQFALCFTIWYPHFPNNSWIAIDHLDEPEATISLKYTRSFFRALSHMLKVGYGTSPPQLIAETWIVILSIIIGCTLIAVFIGLIAKLIASVDSTGKKYIELLNELHRYMKFHKVPKKIQKMCIKFFEQKYRQKYFDETLLIGSSVMSLPLREELAQHTCYNLIQNFEVFRKASPEFVYEVVSRLELQVYFKGEYLVYAGQPQTALFFISSGKVEFRDSKSGKKVATLDEGRYFGVYEFLNKKVADKHVVAVDMCDIYSLSAYNFFNLWPIYPKELQSLQLGEHNAHLAPV